MTAKDKAPDETAPKDRASSDAPEEQAAPQVEVPANPTVDDPIKVPAAGLVGADDEGNINSVRVPYQANVEVVPGDEEKSPNSVPDGGVNPKDAPPDTAAAPPAEGARNPATKADDSS